MAEIKNIYEDSARTQDIYPITHEKAVIDNNGTTAETKFGLLQGLINQKQLEVGAVPIDLTPTKGNTDHIVSSDGIYESKLFDKETVSTDTWITGTVKGAINGSTYAQYTSWDYPKFIPVTGGSMVRVTAGTQKRSVIAFVKNTTMSNGGTVPYATGETGTYIIAVNTSEDFYVPIDANYIHASQKITESNEFPSSVVEMLDAKSATAVLRNEIMAGNSALEEKKQDKYYLSELTASIIEGRDDVNGNNTASRATLRKQQCSKGDVVVFTASQNYPNMRKCFIIKFFDRYDNNKNPSSSIAGPTSGWLVSATAPEDGWYSLVVYSGDTSTPATSGMITNTITQRSYVEQIVKQYAEERFGGFVEDITMKRYVINNQKNIRTYTGSSPLENQLRYTYLTRFGACQSMAIYKDTVFIFGKGGAFGAYEFGTWRGLGSASAILPTDEVEFNASWFSNEFYDANDEFPILYTEAIYTSPAVVGCRIQRLNGVWSITKVQSIYIDGETGGARVAYDQYKDQLIYQANTQFWIYPRPKFADSVEGVSTLMSEDMISAVDLPSGALYLGQDNSIFGNVAVGITYNQNPGNSIFGISLTTGETIFTFSPLTHEGEGVEWYNGRLYICDVQGYLYEIEFL